MRQSFCPVRNDGSWQRYFRLGVVHFMLYPETAAGEGPVLESLTELARDADLEIMEITHIADAGVRRKVRALIEAAGWTVAFGSQPVFLRRKLDLNAADATARAAAVAAARECVDEAAELGAKSIAFLSGPDPVVAMGEAAKGIDPSRAEALRAEARQRLIDSLLEICAYAAKAGLRVVLETFDRAVEKRCLIGPSSDAVKVAQAVRREFPDFGLMLDLSHLPLLQETPEYALRCAGPYLTHVHLGNAVTTPGSPLYGDAHPRFGIPEGANGRDELTRFLRGLFSCGYLREENAATERPVVSFEIKPYQDERPEVILAAAKRLLTAAWYAL
ncbi:MAG: TIM barrel protein [Limnochordales bacterium]|nr:TIM barrel protein [Limnochordales bacterium]